MDHVAIMKKEWKLLPKILTGEKTIESRWYMNKSAPWGRIKAGERVYFKNSGEKVTIQAEIAGVKAYANLTPDRVRRIIDEYGGKDGICITDIEKFYRLFKNKKYCLLIFLKNAKKIKPFDINKQGFGMMAAWMCVEHIGQIKIS